MGLRGQHVLELGSGTGIVGITAALLGAQVRHTNTHLRAHACATLTTPSRPATPRYYPVHATPATSRHIPLLAAPKP